MFDLKYPILHLSCSTKSAPHEKLISKFYLIATGRSLQLRNFFYLSCGTKSAPHEKHASKNFIQNFIWLVPEDLLQKKEDWMLKKEDP